MKVKNWITCVQDRGKWKKEEEEEEVYDIFVRL